MVHQVVAPSRDRSMIPIERCCIQLLAGILRPEGAVGFTLCIDAEVSRVRVTVRQNSTYNSGRSGDDA